MEAVEEVLHFLEGPGLGGAAVLQGEASGVAEVGLGAGEDFEGGRGKAGGLAKGVAEDGGGETKCGVGGGLGGQEPGRGGECRGVGEQAEVVGEESDLGGAAGGGGEGFAEGAEGAEGAVAGGLWRGGGGGRKGGGEGKFELVGAGEGPGVPAALAEVAGEGGAVAVGGEDGVGAGEFEEFEEFGVIGVVAEGEGGVDVVGEAGGWGEGPAAEEGGEFGGDGVEGGGGLGGEDEDAAAGVAAVEFPGGEGDAEGLVGAVHGGHGRGDRDGKMAAAEEGLDFLGLAEGVAEEDGGFAVIEGVAAPALDGGGGVGEGREAEVGAAEGALHDHGVRGEGAGGLGGEAGAEFEVASVEEAGPVGEAGEVDHGAAEDVACGGQDDAVAEVVPGLVPIEGDDFGLRGEAGAEEVGGGERAEDAAVAGEVVGVGVGDEGAVLGAAGVEPELGLGKEEAAAEEAIGKGRFQGWGEKESGAALWRDPADELGEWEAGGAGKE